MRSGHNAADIFEQKYDELIFFLGHINALAFAFDFVIAKINSVGLKFESRHSAPWPVNRSPFPLSVVLIVGLPKRRAMSPIVEIARG